MLIVLEYIPHLRILLLPIFFTLQRVTSPDDCIKRSVGCSFSGVDV